MATKRDCFWTRPTSVFLGLCSRSVASEYLSICSEHQCLQCLQLYDGCSYVRLIRVARGGTEPSVEE